MKYYRILLENAAVIHGKSDQDKIYFNPITGLFFYVRGNRTEFKHITSLIEWTILVDESIYEEIILDGVKILPPKEENKEQKKSKK